MTPLHRLGIVVQLKLSAPKLGDRDIFTFYEVLGYRTNLSISAFVRIGEQRTALLPDFLSHDGI